MSRTAMVNARTSIARHPDAYPALLLGVFCVVWLALAIHPWYRQDWLLENVCVFIAVPIFVFTIGTLRFSNFTYTLLFVFFCLHEVGAHYTYSQVPYDAAFRALSGRSLNALLGFQRNHYDRLIHFLYGFLLLPVARELFAARAPARGVWGFLLPILFVESNSAIFELIEWAAALVFGGELGQAYLGTQGDIWDAQWDMALALLGATLTQCAITLRTGRAVPLPMSRTAPATARLDAAEAARSITRAVSPGAALAARPVAAADDLATASKSAD